MAKRFRRTRRSRRVRARRIKRAYRSRRIAKRRPAYDGGTSIKCHVLTDMTYSTTYFAGDVSVNWGSTTTATNNYLRITQSTEYQNFATLYKEYKLIGVKLRWMPISQVTSSLGSYLQEGWYTTSITQLYSQSTPSNTILGSDFYRSFDPSKPFSTYVKASRYYKTQNQDWQPVGASYNDAGSLFRVFATGYNNGNVLGRVHATYYIKLRGTSL